MAARGTAKVANPTTRKVVALHVPEGKVVKLGDLPFGVLRDIAKRHDANPFNLMLVPLNEKDGVAMEDIYLACCEAASVPAPATLKAQEMWDAVHVVDDDLPEYYEDGSPKADDPTTA